MYVCIYSRTAFLFAGQPGTVVSCNRGTITPLVMVDTRDADRALLKRCAEELNRDVKRTKPNDGGSQKEEGSQFAPAPLPSTTELKVCEQVPPRARKSELVDAVRGVFQKEVSTWLSRIHPLFWVAVSLPTLMANIYWQSHLLVDKCLYEDTPWAVKRLGSLLSRLLPEFSPEEVREFLVHTKLDSVITAYVDILRRAASQSPPIFFSNNFGEPAAFDSTIHWNAGAEALRAGDECMVVVPAMMTEVERFKPLAAISKSCVLATETPSSLQDLLR